MNFARSQRIVRRYLLLLILISFCSAPWALADEYYREGNDWQSTIEATRAVLLAAGLSPETHRAQVYAIRDRLEGDFPVYWDWMLQDSAGAFERWFSHAPSEDIYREALSHVAADMPDIAPAGLDAVDAAGLLDLYVALCERRRAARLANLVSRQRQFVFTKHSNMGSSHYAYTEALSDSQYPADYHFVAGSALCVLEFDGLHATVQTLLADEGGVIRNPDVSWDGTRILFAWKKSLLEDDYHLHELSLDDGAVRQLTSGLGYADYEGIYLPDGNILFNSTRCVQTVDCWWTEVSNLYTCDGDGRYMRRLTFDQVHTNYPTVMHDGRILYTRWDYNDRGQLFPQGLFQMHPDGTGQAEFYGNNSWFPTTLIHARDIPGSPLIAAIATGHHTFQAGQLVLVDPRRGRQENKGVQLIAPPRDTKAVRVDHYGQHGALFQYPWPLSETEFVLSYHPLGYEGQAGGRVDAYGRVSGVNPATTPRFAIYWMDIHGNRELLAADRDTSCNQPVPLAARMPPPARPSEVDYSLDSGTYYVQDIYAGPGLDGVERGVVKRLRVIALEYRAAGIGQNRNDGPAGSALVSTPIAIDNGSWDVKRIIGDADIHDDGSAYFVAPARTPLYFQALDENGQAVQTMRSWSTLQPGEAASCVGCHEHKNTAPTVAAGSLPSALRDKPQSLTPFYGPARAFSFQREIQPILDRHCIGCHNNRELKRGEPGLTHIAAEASYIHPESTLRALSDGHRPAHSGDHDIPRFTWQTRQGGAEWVQYTFNTPRTLSGAAVYWFDDARRGGGCRVPQSWELHYLDGDTWRPVHASRYGVERDRYNRAVFEAVTTTALRLTAHLQDGYSGGILSWRLYPMPEPASTPDQRSVFSLLDEPNHDENAKRMWSDAYLNLTLGGPHELVNWLSAQSAPPMLPPYHAGAARSRLMVMLGEGHYDISLDTEELHKIAAWIDLLVPYCGDYAEANAWSEEEKQKYERFMRKRLDMEALERENIQALLDR